MIRSCHAYLLIVNAFWQRDDMHGAGLENLGV